MRQIFILSPAKTSGERANLIYNPGARFDLARRLQKGGAVALEEVFSFLSGLYFRGKAKYARAFARPPKGISGAFVITSNRGLLPIDLPVTLEELRAFSSVPIEPKEPRYLEPLSRGAELIAGVIRGQCAVVFLGSISTSRYVEPLLRAFGERLLFPPAFVGRGDMSRGGLLLRAASAERELEYAPLSGAIRHGNRPERLGPRTWGYRVLEGTTDLHVGECPNQNCAEGWGYRINSSAICTALSAAPLRS
jgi:hypothetical protein